MKKQTEDKFWKVEKILGVKKGKKRCNLYLVKWKGWSNEDNTWQPYKNLTKVSQMVKKFMEKEKKRMQKTRKLEKRKMNIKNNANQAMKANSKKRGRSFKKNIDSFQEQSTIKKTILEEESTLQKPVDKQPKSIRKKRKIVRSSLSEMMRSKKLQKLKNVSKSKRKIQPKFIVTEMQQAQQKESAQENAFYSESEEQGIEDVIMRCENTEEASIVLRENTLFFRIPFMHGDRVVQLPSDEIAKINPGWLSLFYQSFII